MSDEKNLVALHAQLLKQLWAVIEPHIERQENGSPTPDCFALLSGIIAGLMVEWLDKIDYPEEKAEGFMQFHAVGTLAMLAALRDNKRRRQAAH
jgi:hypothetical protein